MRELGERVHVCMWVRVGACGEWRREASIVPLTFQLMKVLKTSTPQAPLSTKSPLKTNRFFSEGQPALLSSVSTSWYCPCVSPT